MHRVLEAYQSSVAVVHAPCTRTHIIIHLQTHVLLDYTGMSTLPGGNGAYDFLQLALMRATSSEIITDPSPDTPQNRFNALSAPYTPARRINHM